jgi:hypothetical protein
MFAINKDKRKKENIVFIREWFGDSQEVVTLLLHWELSLNKICCRQGSRTVQSCYNCPSVICHRNSFFVQYLSWL